MKESVQAGINSRFRLRWLTARLVNGAGVALGFGPQAEDCESDRIRFVRSRRQADTDRSQQQEGLAYAASHEQLSYDEH